MRRIINGLAYDTDNSEKVHHWWNGMGRDDFHHISEDLYKTRGGRWFVRYAGGALTEYSESCGNNATCGSSGIRPVDEEEARAWLERHADAETFEKHFTAQEA